MSKKRFGWMLGILCALAMTGCTTNPLMVSIVAPAGSTMEIGEKKYALPATVPFNRPDKPGDTYRTNVAFTFPIKGQAIPAEGVLMTYGFVETDVDRLSTNTCNVSEAELAKLMEGYAVIFDGFSASDHKLIYKITIGKKKVIKRLRKLGMLAGLACMPAILSACAPPVDRTTLREVASFQNVARAEYQSIWSSHRFASESPPVIVTVVAPDASANSAVARGSSTTDAKGGSTGIVSLKGGGRTALVKGDSGTSAGKGSLNTTAATGAGTTGAAIGTTQTDAGKGSSGVSAAASTQAAASAIGSGSTGSAKGSSGTTAIASSGATTTAVGSTKIVAGKGGAGGSDSAIGTGTVDLGKGTVASNTARGTLEINARVGQAQIDNARGSALVSVARPQLEVKKFADKTHVLPGDPVIFTITVTNNGSINVEKVEVFDELPSEVEPISITGGEMRTNKKVATARFPGPLHPGESASFAVTTRTK